MKQLYFILVAAVILAGCQPQEEVIKSHGIKEVHLVQFRYYYPEEYTYKEGDIPDPKPKIIGYTSLQPKSGKMEAWTGFFDDSVFHHPYGYAPRATVATGLANIAALEADQFYYHDWENPNEMGPMYSGPQLFFLVVKEDGNVYTIGFDRWKLPEELKELFNAMNYYTGSLTEGKRIMDTSSTKSATFLHTIDEDITGKVRFPPTLVKVKYTPPPAARN
ncbi:hypothetical protein [Pontibacter kalidii]|uniref:hypothetical protein n=1 Tax=Pontibacter kalidii TaxID=2592049 RepID=UPI0022555C25|nr:hypothetical protein [Pontibacter kalidii]